jgi:hypothetical protein
MSGGDGLVLVGKGANGAGNPTAAFFPLSTFNRNVSTSPSRRCSSRFITRWGRLRSWLWAS